MLAVLAGWVVFRADTLGHAWRMLGTMVGFGTAGIGAWPVNRFATASVLTAMVAAAALVVAPATGITARLGTRPAGVAGAGWDAAVVLGIIALFVASAVAVSAGTYNPFIYFRF